MTPAAVGVVALTGSDVGRVGAVVVLAAVATIVWLDALRMQRTLRDAETAMEHAVVELRNADVNVRRGANVGEYAAVQSDALGAMTTYAESLSDIALIALKRLADLDAETANELADRSLDAVSLMRERMPDFASATAEFLERERQLR